MIKLASKRSFSALLSSFSKIKLPWGEINVPFNVAADLATNDILVCFDDLERKGDGLSVKDFLGYASWLRDTKNCKVVFLVNSNEEGLLDYEKYKEKAIDLELSFTPSSIDCINIALDSKLEWVGTASDCIGKLDIRNIRIIKKIAKAVDTALLVVKKATENADSDFSNEIRHQICTSIVLFCWAHFDASGDAIPLDFIEAKNSWIEMKHFREKDDKIVGKWNEKLTAYGYLLSDDIDLLLIEFIKYGWLNDAGLIKIIKGRLEERNYGKRQRATDDAWDLFRDSFEDDKISFMDKIYTQTKQCIEHITLGTLVSSYAVLNQLGEVDKSNELIEAFIDVNKSSPEKFKSEYATVPQELRKRFDDLYQESDYPKSVKEILLGINEKQSWGDREVKKLLKASPDEYYILFKSLRGAELHACIKSALFFGQLGNATEEHLKLSAPAKEALLRISNESEFNQIRIQRFGYKIT